MADEMYDYLHMTIVQHYCKKNLSKNELIETLENLGFRVGYSLIEKLVLFFKIYLVSKTFNGKTNIMKRNKDLSYTVIIHVI